MSVSVSAQQLKYWSGPHCVISADKDLIVQIGHSILNTVSLSSLHEFSFALYVSFFQSQGSSVDKLLSIVVNSVSE